MPGDFVLVVDADLSAYRAIIEGLPADTYDVVSVATARAGFNVACALEPHVIVASLDLPDADAIELSGVIRGHETRVAYTPLVVLTQTSDEATRLAVLNAGADVVLSAPIEPVELVAQVNAMLAMSERIRELERGQSMLPPASDGQTYAVLGDPTKMSIASVLGALELEQRSGELRFAQSSNGQKLSIHVASGVVSGGQLDGKVITGLEALKRGLTWDGTQFGFIACEPIPPPPFAQPLGALLLAAFNETEPSDRLSHEIEASRRLLGDTAAGLKLVESVAGLRLGDSVAGLALSTSSIRLGETASGLRLEDTAAGRRFLRDTAAGLRLTSTGIRLGETAAGQRAPSGEALTNTLTSFGPTEPAPPPSPPSVTPSQRAKMRSSRPDLSPERKAMRQTQRGIEVDPAKPSSR